MCFYRKSTGILLAVLISHFNPVIAIIYLFVQRIICFKTYMTKCVSDFEHLKCSCFKRTKLYTPKFFFYILATYFFNNCFSVYLILVHFHWFLDIIWINPEIDLTDLQLEFYLYCTIGMGINTFSVKLNEITKFIPLRSKNLLLLIDNFCYIT